MPPEAAAAATHLRRRRNGQQPLHAMQRSGRRRSRSAISPTTAAAARRSCKDSRNLNPATAGIADELSKQYYLGYPSLGKKDGRWHSIRVEVRNKAYRVRARRGYVASQGAS